VTAVAVSLQERRNTEVSLRIGRGIGEDGSRFCPTRRFGSTVRREALNQGCCFRARRRERSIRALGHAETGPLVAVRIETIAVARVRTSRDIVPPDPLEAALPLFTLHAPVVRRAHEEGRAGWVLVGGSTGQAVALFSLSTMVGFGSLMVARHSGIFSMGLLLTVAVGSVLLVSLTVLPLLLQPPPSGRERPSQPSRQVVTSAVESKSQPLGGK